MKTTKKQIAIALKELTAANGRRKERTITEQELLELIEKAEQVYKENSRKKYFKGVILKEYADWSNKPNAYKYKAYQTFVCIKIFKNEKVKIEVDEITWGYISAKEKKVEIVFEA